MFTPPRICNRSLVHEKCTIRRLPFRASLSDTVRVWTTSYVTMKLHGTITNTEQCLTEKWQKQANFQAKTFSPYLDVSLPRAWKETCYLRLAVIRTRIHINCATIFGFLLIWRCVLLIWRCVLALGNVCIYSVAYKQSLVTFIQMVELTLRRLMSYIYGAVFQH